MSERVVIAMFRVEAPVGDVHLEAGDMVCLFSDGEYAIVRPLSIAPEALFDAIARGDVTVEPYAATREQRRARAAGVESAPTRARGALALMKGGAA